MRYQLQDQTSLISAENSPVLTEQGASFIPELSCIWDEEIFTILVGRTQVMQLMFQLLF
jgi:hypothetical protein